MIINILPRIKINRRFSHGHISPKSARRMADNKNPGSREKQTPGFSKNNEEIINENRIDSE
ncbi:MAG: hypothetical protein RL563_1076 [Pseudomonadota bacterium]|jgi:hypothetical protein